MPPQPLQLVLGRSHLQLWNAGNTSDTLIAYKSYKRAYNILNNTGFRERSQIALPLAGMGVAAARAGFLTSATNHLHHAVWDTMEASGADPNIMRLYSECLNMRRSRVNFSARDVLVESRPEGNNYDRYKEVAGRWLDSGTPFLSKSVAPGLTTDSVCGSRKYQFTGVEKNAVRAHVAARFFPRVTRQQTYYVYVTWPVASNAKPVLYNVWHAGGETTVPVVQDGWDPVLGNANRWVRLGEFTFRPGDDHFVEVSITPQAETPLNNTRGQVHADAVLFAENALVADEDISVWEANDTRTTRTEIGPRDSYPHSVPE